MTFLDGQINYPVWQLVYELQIEPEQLGDRDGGSIMLPHVTIPSLRLA